MFKSIGPQKFSEIKRWLINGETCMGLITFYQIEKSKLPELYEDIKSFNIDPNNESAKLTFK